MSVLRSKSKPKVARTWSLLDESSVAIRSTNLPSSWIFHSSGSTCGCDKTWNSETLRYELVVLSTSFWFHERINICKILTNLWCLLQSLFGFLSFPEAEIMDKSYLVAIAHCMFVGERINTYYSDFCPFLIVPGQILFSKKKYSYYRSVFEKEFETVLAFKDWTKIEIYLQHQVRNQYLLILYLYTYNFSMLI